ncbi:hypothetical protein [Thiomicrospira sp. ALE5]|uniref:hypothetical protein n=1 Tax=Thiomicrospira sp. ALE5 TaxID=748650 RepID=UPI0008EEFB8E|nr:hypothetical protein [Thiomicrospira sp. ALE5]SFR53956.1 hypothetical protein SAMN03092900_0941 [Thiomicrospira sp. ALE5]
MLVQITATWSVNYHQGIMLKKHWSPSRRVVGWAMDNRINVQLVKTALLRALWNRKLTRGLIIHTDHYI